MHTPFLPGHHWHLPGGDEPIHTITLVEPHHPPGQSGPVACGALTLQACSGAIAIWAPRRLGRGAALAPASPPPALMWSCYDLASWQLRWFSWREQLLARGCTPTHTHLARLQWQATPGLAALWGQPIGRVSASLGAGHGWQVACHGASTHLALRALADGRLAWRETQFQTEEAEATPA